jgi:predicted NBD/HSP70 family sugar kinase
MCHVIGLDAGGTNTVGLLADESGAVLRDSRGRSARGAVTLALRELAA